MLQALVFDFDGLIVDTEWPVFQAWQEMYQQYGVELTLEVWLPSIGRGASTQIFHPHDYLESLLHRSLERDVVRAQCRQRSLELVALQPILPGVRELIVEAKSQGLGLAVASSSERSWVAGNLERLGLLEYFDVLSCGDEIVRTKPAPDLYQNALDKLGVRAEQAIAFEDSLNGMLAARGAGIFCVVVPNLLTRHLSFGEVDLQVTSMAELTLDQLNAYCNHLPEKSPSAIISPAESK